MPKAHGGRTAIFPIEMLSLREHRHDRVRLHDFEGFRKNIFAFQEMQWQSPSMQPMGQVAYGNEL